MTQEVYKSSTHGAIPLSFTGRHRRISEAQLDAYSRPTIMAEYANRLVKVEDQVKGIQAWLAVLNTKGPWLGAMAKSRKPAKKLTTKRKGARK